MSKKRLAAKAIPDAYATSRETTPENTDELSHRAVEERMNAKLYNYFHENLLPAVDDHLCKVAESRKQIPRDYDDALKRQLQAEIDRINQKRTMKINQDANLPSLGNAVKTLEKSIEILHDLKADVEKLPTESFQSEIAGIQKAEQVINRLMGPRTIH